jgi:hypothetical protein
LAALRSLPLSHVLLRLEAAAAGLWPEPAEPATDASRVVRCLRAMLAPNAKGTVSTIIAGELGGWGLQCVRGQLVRSRAHKP